MSEPSDLRKQLGSLVVNFRPAEGGRLESLTYAGVEIVLPAGRVPGFYGDTFWPSPQARFNWPPPPVLDAAPYAVLTDTPYHLALQSAPDEEYGYTVEKRFTLAADSLGFEFTLTNLWDQAQTVAPWQVTRAVHDGLVIWAEGTPFTDADRLQKQSEDPGCWYLHAEQKEPFPGLTVENGHGSVAIASVPRTCKLFADARGWLAHVHDGMLFLRLFPDLDLTQAAPRQGEVELFFGLEANYIELENQGAYETLEPGQSLQYSVEWRFAALEPTIPTDRLTPALLAAIAALRDRPSAF